MAVSNDFLQFVLDQLSAWGVVLPNRMFGGVALYQEELVFAMVALYSKNSIKNGWWDAVNIIIWGGSTRLSGEDQEVQKELQNLLELGVMVEACKACADKMKISSTLKDLGISVKYMSKLTGIIKKKEHLLTI